MPETGCCTRTRLTFNEVVVFWDTLAKQGVEICVPLLAGNSEAGHGRKAVETTLIISTFVRCGAIANLVAIFVIRIRLRVIPFRSKTRPHVVVDRGSSVGLDSSRSKES